MQKVQQFQEYTYNLNVTNLKLNRNKCPGNIFISWNLSTTHKDGDIIYGPAILSQDGMLMFEDTIALSTKLLYNTIEKQFHPKKSFLHFMNSPQLAIVGNKYTNLGTITIDLAQLSQAEDMTDPKNYTLEKCLDRSATVALIMNAKRNKQGSNLDRSQRGSVDSKGSRKRKEDEVSRDSSKEKQKQFTDEILRTIAKQPKKTLDRSKTAQKPLKTLSFNTNTQIQSSQSTGIPGILSQFRSERQIRDNMSRQVNQQRYQNNLLTMKIAELQEIIRKSNSDGTNQTITELEQALSLSKTNLDNLKHQLHSSRKQIKQLRNQTEILELENQQLKSQVQTASKLGKKVRFNLKEETLLQDIKQQLKKQKMNVVELETKIIMQAEDYDSLKSQNINLLQQLDAMSHEIQLQRKQADYYRVKYQQLKLSRNKKRKEKDIRHKQEMTALYNQILRLHDELYKLRMNQQDFSHSEEVIEQNKQLKRVCSQKKKFQNIHEAVMRLSKNRTNEDLLKTVRSKSRTSRQKYDSIRSIDGKTKDILASINHIKSLNVKLGSVNDKKLSVSLRELQSKVESLSQLPLQK